MKVGILALQGNFEAHHQRLRELGASALYVRKPEELHAISGLVIPGGESSAMLKLMGDEFREQLSAAIQSGLPVLATCAGVILLAHRVENPEQESLGLLDVTVRRNAYGRQLDSFIEDGLCWTDCGADMLLEATERANAVANNREAVFIRAPKIVAHGPAVTVLARCEGDPVLVHQGKILAATYHPEMSARSFGPHQLFLQFTDHR